MINIVEEVDNMVNSRSEGFCNSYGVCLRWIEEQLVLTGVFPFFMNEGCTLEFGNCYKTTWEFVEALALKHAKQLEEITPHDLFQLFYAGKMLAWTNVYTKAFMGLVFKIKNGKIHLRDVFGNNRPIEREFQGADDFINYSREYYKKWLENG